MSDAFYEKIARQSCDEFNKQVDGMGESVERKVQAAFELSTRRRLD